MYREILKNDLAPKRDIPKEGDLFKVIQTHGKTFEIRYGFYEEGDRHLQFAEPMPCYPDFILEPQHTPDGIPFVTAIQDICSHFVGNKDANSTCGDCADYRHCDELLGTCASPRNILTVETRQNE